MRGAGSKLRNLLSGRTTSASASVTDNLIFSSLAKASHSTAIRANDWTRTPLMSAIVPTLSATHFRTFGINHSRSFSSSALHEILSDFPEVQIETDEQFNKHLRQIQDEFLPAIFYFPKVAAPYGITDAILAVHLTYFERYPRRVYKINIAEESLGFILSKFDMHRPMPCYLFCYKHLRKDSSKVVLIETSQQYNESRRKVKRERLTAIYYFTADAYEPCRLFCPIFERLSEKYPHVTMYKIDMDMIMEKEKEDLDILSQELFRRAFPWPSMDFYRNGENVRKLCGSEIKKNLRRTMRAYD